jgi:hypothetical protein
MDIVLVVLEGVSAIKQFVNIGALLFAVPELPMAH